MKYRSKLYLALAGTALISSLLGFLLLFYEFRHHAFTDMQTKVLTVAATTAALIDAEPLKSIHRRSDEEGAAYLAIKRELIKARDANQRADIFIKSLYTLKPDPSDPNQLIYVVDAQENAPEMSHAGEIDQNARISGVIFHLEDYYSPGQFTADPWGLWVSGFAPIYDSEGNYVATVGADISVERYLTILHSLIQFFSLAFLVSLLFAFIGGYFLARKVTLSLRTLLHCVREIGQGNLSVRSPLQTHDEFEELSMEVNRMAQGLKERERLKENFARYVSLHVMEKILDAEHIVNLEGERRKITVLFSDIRQFTQLSEELSPEQVVSLLNTYFKSMLDVIFQHQGTLDKFLGDGIMVEFGAPLDDSLQEKHAVRAAIAMHKELEQLNAKWRMENTPVIQMGIGIHTGLAVVGNIGSEKRIDYTAIGDTVNVASRLEQATKQLKTPILISETTYLAIKEEMKATYLGPMTLPGRKEAITVYSVPLEDIHP
jgi:adenylate cyclase